MLRAKFCIVNSGLGVAGHFVTPLPPYRQHTGTVAHDFDRRSIWYCLSNHLGVEGYPSMLVMIGTNFRTPAPKLSFTNSHHLEVADSVQGFINISTGRLLG